MRLLPCLQVRSESRCLCGHRLKEHATKEGSRKLRWEFGLRPDMILIRNVGEKSKRCLLPADAGTASAGAQISFSLWQRVPGGQPVRAACALYAYVPAAIQPSCVLRTGFCGASASTSTQNMTQCPRRARRQHAAARTSTVPGTVIATTPGQSTRRWGGSTAWCF